MIPFAEQAWLHCLLVLSRTRASVVRQRASLRQPRLSKRGYSAICLATRFFATCRPRPRDGAVALRAKCIGVDASKPVPSASTTIRVAADSWPAGGAATGSGIAQPRASTNRQEGSGQCGNGSQSHRAGTVARNLAWPHNTDLRASGPRVMRVPALAPAWPGPLRFRRLSGDFYTNTSAPAAVNDELDSFRAWEGIVGFSPPAPGRIGAATDSNDGTYNGQARGTADGERTGRWLC